MGRKPYKNSHLPPRLRKRKQKSGAIHYYYDSGGKPRKEIPLGSDYALAIQEWARLEKEKIPANVTATTFRHIAEVYWRDVLPKKAPRTQKDNNIQIRFLYAFFDNPPAPLEKIEPSHIKKYMRWRSAPFKLVKDGQEIQYEGSETQANREKALFSHIWNYARGEGFTKLPNPCAGIKGFTEDARDVYVSDTELKAADKEISQPVRDYVDLLYLTGQRPGDVLKLGLPDIKDGVLFIKQGKTKKPLRMSIEGELKIVLDRIAEQNKKHAVRPLRFVVDEKGQPLTLSGLRARFKKEFGKPDFQLRDLRAKAGTDVAEETGDARKAQKQLGHSTITMTETYLRSRGEKVKPTK